MVIGQNVATVQRVSRYCLAQGAEVFPYYGIPSIEEISVFAPEVFVLCLPLPECFWQQLPPPCILWSEQQIKMDFPLVSTRRDLESSLSKALQG
ncbi:hypothetical protein IQ238_12150 [Pleurocapsales cyanobacterium LEGE 06147]|nr:hypothetical protein [Pleurocapsales cyanobacterium LEGE 06147]